MTAFYLGLFDGDPRMGGAERDPTGDGRVEVDLIDLGRGLLENGDAVRLGRAGSDTPLSHLALFQSKDDLQPVSIGPLACYRGRVLEGEILSFPAGSVSLSSPA